MSVRPDIGAVLAARARMLAQAVEQLDMKQKKMWREF